LGGYSLNILRVAADLYPSVIGGVGLHAHEMSKEQINMGHNLTVYTCTDLNPVSSSVYNYEVHGFKPFIQIFGNSIAPLMILDLLKNMRNYDIIHAHSHLCFSTNLCAILRKIGSSPLVITTHGGLNSQRAPKLVQSIYNATVAKMTFDAADKIICYTDIEKSEMIGFGVKPEKIAVIHNGIDTDRFTPPKEPNFNKKNLLWIGRYVPGKGVEYLIEAFNLLKQKHPDAFLTMVGGGPQKEKIIERINELNLQNSIVIKDFIPNSEIVHLYHNSSVLLLSSLREGVPRVILEAMACGVPVVCTRLPHLVDIVDCGGFLVPLKDPCTLAEKTSQILSDPILAKKLGENGRKKVVENYSWKDTVQKTIKLYGELV
jgi:glycosyltransferase involved in cell wall biosynthesis